LRSIGLDPRRNFLAIIVKFAVIRLPPSPQPSPLKGEGAIAKKM
jgi:hypothetical protein